MQQDDGRCDDECDDETMEDATGASFLRVSGEPVHYSLVSRCDDGCNDETMEQQDDGRCQKIAVGPVCLL